MLDKRLEEIKERWSRGLCTSRDVTHLIDCLDAEVKRRKAAEAVIESGGAAEYQVVVEAWRQIVKEEA